MSEEAKATVFVDNERTRVTEWRFVPRASTGWHRHEYDYVIIPLHDGELELIKEGNQVSTEKLTAGTPYFCNAGDEHDVISPNAHEFAFIEVELK